MSATGVIRWNSRGSSNSALMSLRKKRRSREIAMEKLIESSEPRRQQFAEPALNPERRLAEHECETILTDAITKLSPSIRKAVEIHQRQERSLEGTASSVYLDKPEVDSGPARWESFFEGDASMKRQSILEWYRILRVRRWNMFQAIRYALWLAR